MTGYETLYANFQGPQQGTGLIAVFLLTNPTPDFAMENFIFRSIYRQSMYGSGTFRLNPVSDGACIPYSEVWPVLHGTSLLDLFFF